MNIPEYLFNAQPGLHLTEDRYPVNGGRYCPGCDKPMREIGATVATNSPEGALYFFYCRRCIDYVRRLSRAKQCRFCTEVEERLQDPRKLTRYTWLATGDVPAITVPPDVCPEPTPELIGWLLFRWGKPEGSDDGLCSVCHRVNWEGWFLQWSPFGAALWGFCDDCAG